MNQEPTQPKEFEPAPPLAGTEPSDWRHKHMQKDNEPNDKHHQSTSMYPELSLSSGEYVIEVVRRHPIGLLSIWAVTLLLVLISFAIIPVYDATHADISKLLATNGLKLPGSELLLAPVTVLAGLFVLGGWIATIVYNGNKFYLTNESIIQFIQTSLFNTQRQMVNLINVEDVSAQQTGIVQQVLNYGTLRVSTQGEETVYHFRFVASPNRVVNVINEASEQAVKKLEGRSNYPPTEY